MNKIKKILIKNITYLGAKNLIKIPDKIYLQLKYETIIGNKLNLVEPKTFNEKLQWLKLYDRNPKYINMVDKYEAKQYVSNLIGNQYIIPTLGIYNKFEEINFEKLPNEFVLKPTHTSGDIYVCKNKENINLKELKRLTSKWLKRNYYYVHREWPYKNIKPRLIIEKYMKEENKEELTDYKFMCFNGKVKCSFVCLDRYSKDGLKVDFYDINWKKLPFSRHYPNSDIIIPKPHNYELMINLAEKLSKGIPFVRVDFYEINGKVYFGELTFYPGSGFEEFKPEKFDKILGDLIKLPKI